ncbi:N-6 DNA methylase [Microtetraspora sp. NBRC 13810]|uniref:N-6 DNA methylase n=1 Tax=Microtetraspora sp. NBRC 13810 TaxID=3030990 RepID=UPI0025551CCC|nr:N-6 DNA methylase [Microtetraspora sp. NBRC 13810]
MRLLENDRHDGSQPAKDIFLPSLSPAADQQLLALVLALDLVDSPHDLFEDCLERFSTRHGIRGEYYTPSGIVQLMASMLMPLEGDRILSPSSIIKFLACCATHDPVGCSVTPRTWTRRVLVSMTTGQYRRLNSMVSQWKKSHARIPRGLSTYELAPGRSRASRYGVDAGLLQDEPHRGGSHPVARSGEFSGDPPVSPQRVLPGQTKCQGPDGGAGGRPPLGAAFDVQRRRTRSACQRSSVPGVTNNRRRPAGESSRASALITAQSAHDGRGLATCRRNTAS